MSVLQVMVIVNHKSVLLTANKLFELYYITIEIIVF